MAVSWASVLLPPLLYPPWQGPRLTEWASYWIYIAQFVDIKLEVVHACVPFPHIRILAFPAFGVAFLLRLFPGVGADMLITNLRQDI
jgi:hypothetical protein